MGESPIGEVVACVDKPCASFILKTCSSLRSKLQLNRAEVRQVASGNCVVAGGSSLMFEGMQYRVLIGIPGL